MQVLKIRSTKTGKDVNKAHHPKSNPLLNSWTLWHWNTTFPPHFQSSDIVSSSHPAIHKIYCTLFKWRMMQIPVNQWAVSEPGCYRRDIRRKCSEDVVSIHLWRVNILDGDLLTSLSLTHTENTSFSSTRSHMSASLCKEPNCHCSRRKAWIILLVLMFSIIADPPGTLYSRLLASLSDSCSHPSVVSYVILPPINTGHRRSNLIRRRFALWYKIWVYGLVLLVRDAVDLVTRTWWHGPVHLRRHLICAKEIHHRFKLLEKLSFFH